MGALQTGRAIWFTGPRQIELRECEVRPPGAGEVLVRATRSLISAGTEMVVYRGNTTPGDRMPPMSEGRFPFPTKYGYQTVGRVVEAGAGAGLSPGERVFTRHPHQELFTITAEPALVTSLPDDVDDETAAFLNLTRVALTAVLDVPVKVGEVVVVLGQGIVGMLCARLARLNAAALIVVDPVESRRRLALQHGADAAVEPSEVATAVAELSEGRGADVVFEASGAPPALQSAIEVAADHGEVVAVSLYGNLPVPLRLVPEFHYRRLRITSSQAGDQPRWDSTRRSEASLRLLRRLGTEGMVGASFPFGQAGDAYRLIDGDAANVLGVMLRYG